MKRLAFILIIGTTATLFSCNKLIESKETDLVAGDIALRTVAKCEQAVIGAYIALVPQMDILLNSVFSDELKVGEFYNAQTIHEWQYSQTDVSIRDNLTAINPLYAIVDRANRVLKALPNAVEESAGDAAKKNQLRGEALFLRAYALFSLYQYYGAKYTPDALAMPYPETPTIEPLARIKADEYFQKLYADIAAAKPLLPATLADKNRANQIAASGLLARIALYKEDWATAETEATAYINALPLATIANFPSIWTDASTTEVAFQIVRTPTVGARLGSIFRATSPSATNLGTVTWRPSDKIWDAYGVGDVRFTTYLRDEPLLTASTPPRNSRIIRKYAGGSYNGAYGPAVTNENVANVKLFRTAEMYLIRAEARANKAAADLAGATQDINTLRSNRITGYVNIPNFANATEANNAIIDERFKELAFEGHRFWDLKRKGLPVTRLAADAPNANSTTLAAGNFRFALPIPQPEINANPKMQQNQGY